MVDRRKVCLVFLLIYFFRAANRRRKMPNKLRILTDARSKYKDGYTCCCLVVCKFFVCCFWFSPRFTPSSETQGQIVGPKTKIKTGGKKFDEQKYERKILAEKFSAQSGASIRSAVWNWCVKSLSPGARTFLSYFCSSNVFPPVLIFVFGPTICPWVSDLCIFMHIYICSSRTCEKNCHILIGCLFVNLRLTHEPCLGITIVSLYCFGSPRRKFSNYS